MALAGAGAGGLPALIELAISSDLTSDVLTTGIEPANRAAALGACAEGGGGPKGLLDAGIGDDSGAGEGVGPDAGVVCALDEVLEEFEEVCAGPESAVTGPELRGLGSLASSGLVCAGELLGGAGGIGLGEVATDVTGRGAALGLAIVTVTG